MREGQTQGHIYRKTGISWAMLILMASTDCYPELQLIYFIELNEGCRLIVHSQIKKRLTVYS